MASVSLSNVSKQFPGGVQAVRDLSLDVADGEFVVLVGPSGCGKSTVLRLIAGLEQPGGGAIRIGDRDVAGVAPKDRDVAMVFQNYALYPHMNVYRNLAFALRMRKVPREEIDRRVRRVAGMLGIGELLERKPRALSGGQQQRVAVGRAIVREPACFLFDEPLSNLDARLRVGMRGELKQLHQRLRTTTLYVTHDQEEAMTLGDRIVVMNDGRVHQVGPALSVYRRPADSFVAEFIGSPPMNLISGRLDRRDGQVCFDDGRGLRLPIGAESSSMPDQVVLGVRPEALKPAADGTDLGIELEIALCEPVGDRMDVHLCTTDGSCVLARVPADDGLRPGQQMRIRVDEDQVHVFEPGPAGVRLN